MEEGYGKKITTCAYLNKKSKQHRLKDYFLLGYPPSPFFLFVWKGKESSLHPLRSLPDPFVNLHGLVTHSLLPKHLLINAKDGQSTCVPMSSGSRQTRVQILPSAPAGLRLTRPMMGFLLYMPEYTGWLLFLPITLWKRSVILCSSPSRTGAAVSITSF